MEESECSLFPESCASTICSSFHSNPHCAHAGVFKTYEWFWKRYYWRGMFTFVRQFIRGCQECQRQKKPTPPGATPLQSLSCIDHPFKRVGIIIHCPLPLIMAGNRWAVVAVDHLKRYAGNAAPTTATTQDVAAFMPRVLYYFMALLVNSSVKEAVCFYSMVFKHFFNSAIFYTGSILLTNLRRLA